MKKRIIIVVLVVCVLAAFGWRVYMVNKDVVLFKVKTYQLGEYVPFEKDFSDNAKEIIEGYEVAVLDSEILPTDEFYKAYKLEEELSAEDFAGAKYFYLVKVSIKNVNNKGGNESGIGLSTFCLSGTNYYLALSPYIFELINPSMPGSSFSLKEGTEKEVIVPFSINPDVDADYEEMIKLPPKLQITEFPVRKLISIR